MQKTEIPGIYKVSEGVLVNVDNDALSKYKKKKETSLQKESRINSLETKLNTLESSLEEIKTLLMKALTK